MQENNANQPPVATNSPSAVTSESGSKKVKHNKLLPIVIILAVLVVIGIGLVVWMLINNGSKDSEINDLKTQLASGVIAEDIVEVKDESTGETIKFVKVPVSDSKDDAAVRDLIDKLYVALEDKTTTTPTMLRFYGSGLVQYKPEGMKSAIALNKTYGLTVFASDYSSELKRVSTIIVDELQKNGFKKYDHAPMFMNSYINEQSGIVCVDTGASGNGIFWDSSVVCGSVNWVDVDDMALENQLAEAFKEKEGEYLSFLVASSSDIKDSGYERYQTISATTNNARVVFYRVSPDSPWQFFRGMQDVPACSDYNTDDLKRAFVGETCWDMTTDKYDTVKP